MVTGLARHFIISKDGKSQTSYARGGHLNFKFLEFGIVTLEKPKIRDVITKDGTVMVYKDDQLLERVSLPRTGSGDVKTLALAVGNATCMTATLIGSGAVDDLIFFTPR